MRELAVMKQREHENRVRPHSHSISSTKSDHCPLLPHGISALNNHSTHGRSESLSESRSVGGDSFPPVGNFIESLNGNHLNHGQHRSLQTPSPRGWSPSHRNNDVVGGLMLNRAPGSSRSSATPSTSTWSDSSTQSMTPSSPPKSGVSRLWDYWSSSSNGGSSVSLFGSSPSGKNTWTPWSSSTASQSTQSNSHSIWKFTPAAPQEKDENNEKVEDQMM